MSCVYRNTFTTKKIPTIIREISSVFIQDIIISYIPEQIKRLQFRNSHLQPLSDSQSGKIEFVNSSNISIYCDIAINNDTVRVLNNHLQSIQFTQENINFIDSLGLHKNRRNISGGMEIASG
jgi:hypothetical protein